MSVTEAYDFVVVGAGSAGCAVTHRLVTGSDARVLLLEAGGPDTRPEIHREQVSATLALWRPGELDWGYATEPEPGLAGRRVPALRGKVWGGCSSVNGMLHVRGNRRDFDGWGVPGWSHREVLPYFRRSEDYAGGASEYRGAGGPLSVIRHADPTPVSLRLFAAGAEVGLRDAGTGFDYNADRQEDSVFLYQATKTTGHERSSGAAAYLRPVLGRPGLSVRSGATATRILFAGGRAVGVEYVQDGEVRQARADHEVIVCAGAFGSPYLLLRSGVGDAAATRRHGIGVVADLPGVGRNLQDHLIVGTAWLSREEQPREPTLISETGFFTRTRPGEGSPDLQMNCGGLKFVDPALDREGPGFTLAPVLAQPRSVGSVGLHPAGPDRPPLLRCNYLSDPADLETLLHGIALARALARTDALAEVAKTELAPGPRVTSREDLVDFVRRSAGTVWHPVGTCALGDVVDAELRVRGVAGVRVADASVMPRIVAGNTNAACVMIGEKASDLVLAAHSGTI
ncbi:GMC family oxidoreductase N-terminal domain-containing protein [Streptomyces sp. NPDC006393]|uniref:GMC family oxidoreductase n=1 Tax=Streptomyces sp. NPDC006393 TaxID=3156763 RepID=UPI003408AC39